MYFINELETHKQIFPLATPQDQLMHLCEELNERQVAKKTYFDEWADALFVTISLQRFNETKILAEIMLDKLYYNQSITTQKALDNHLAKAIEKVKSRKYYFINGRYEREKNEEK